MVTWDTITLVMVTLVDIVIVMVSSIINITIIMLPQATITSVMVSQFTVAVVTVTSLTPPDGTLNEFLSLLNPACDAYHLAQYLETEMSDVVFQPNTRGPQLFAVITLWRSFRRDDSSSRVPCVKGWCAAAGNCFRTSPLRTAGGFWGGLIWPPKWPTGRHFRDTATIVFFRCTAWST